MKYFKKLLLILLFIISVTCIYFSSYTVVIASSTYYDSIDESLEGEQLLTQLRTLITTTHTYKTTYVDCKTAELVEKTDADPNVEGNIILFWSGLSIPSTWDNGTSWNREHVWPKSNSWFYEDNAGSDLHHIRPADPSVNSTHNNNPYGIVAGEYYVNTSAQNGNVLTECEYNGGIFEPCDNRKGDVARIFFYLITRYEEADLYLDSDLSNGDITQAITDFDLLLEWNNSDPVDDLERNRNEAVYEIQGNRNPFIDNSNYANLIWNENDGEYFDINVDYDSNLCDVSINGNSSDNKYNGNVTISVNVNNGCNYLGLRNKDTGVVVTTDTTYTINNVSSNYNFEVLTEISSYYKLVTDINEIQVGSKVIIVANDYNYALSTTQNNNNRGQISVTKNNSNINNVSDVQVLTVEEGLINNTYSFNTGNGYLCSASSSSNYLRTENSKTNNSSWSISINNGISSIISQGEYTRNELKYNSSSSLFSCYGEGNTQKDICLYIYYFNEYDTFKAYKTKSSIILNYNNIDVANEKEYSYTFTSKTFGENNQLITLGNVDWTLVNNGNYYSYDNTKGQQIGSASNPAQSLTLTSSVFENVKSIKINTSGANGVSASLSVLINGKQIGTEQSITSAATDYTFICDNIESGNICLSYSQTSSKALYIKSITIYYEYYTTNYELTSAGLRFGTCISKEMYDSINTNEAVWGVEYYIGDVNDMDTVEGIKVVCNPTRVSSNVNGVVDENGNYYQFALVFINMKYADIDTKVSARVFVTIGDDTYYMNSVTYSIRDIVNIYLEQNNNEDIQRHKDILNHIKNYTL